MYRDGLGVPRDYCEAAKWLRKAAKQGYADAEFALGVAYRDGLGLAKDPCKAKELFGQAARQGNIPAYFEITRLHCEGRASGQDGDEAKDEEERYEEAAKQGYADAEFALGVAYRDGRGVELGRGEPKDLFLSAAQKGHVPAFLELKKLDGDDSTESHLNQGDPGAEVIARLRRERLIDSFRQVAQRGNADAEFALGVAFRDEFGEKEDRGIAETWFLKAAQHGNARAYFELGTMALEDSGEGQDIDNVLEWLRKSAEGGCGDAFQALQRLAVTSENPLARVVLGEMYLLGLGVSRDYFKAAKWFRSAAKLGDRDGQFQLGQMCRDGLGNPVKWEGEQANPDNQPPWNQTYREGRGDPGEWKEPSTWTKHAVEWFCKAAGQGHAGAYCELSRIFVGFSSEQARLNEETRKNGTVLSIDVEVPKGIATISINLPEDFLEQEDVEKKLQEVLQERRQEMWQESQDVPEDLRPEELQTVREKLNRMREAAKNREMVRKELEDAQQILAQISREMPEERRKEALECFRRATEQGDAEAEFALGVAYRDGFGVEKSVPRAAKWFGMAAQRGHVRAYLELGRQNRYSNVMREKVDELDNVREEAVECFRRRASASSDAEAEFALGVACRDGVGVRKSVPEAARWFGLAARRGHVRAFYELSKMQDSGIANGQDGSGVDEALRRAAKNFERNAREGDAGAECALGVAYHLGIGVEQGRADAEKWFERAERRGNADGHFQRGMMDFDHWNWIEFWATGDEAACPARDVGEAHVRAEEGFRQASKLGHPGAQDLLDRAEAHEESRWQAEPYYDDSLWQFEDAAWEASDESEREDRTYQSALNLMENRDTEPDFVKGATQLWRLAENGHGDARYRLGLAYRDGSFGVERTLALAEAERWLRKAADRGHPDAPAVLASLRSDGNPGENE